jgi:hypothetical protein
VINLHGVSLSICQCPESMMNEVGSEAGKAGKETKERKRKE